MSWQGIAGDEGQHAPGFPEFAAVAVKSAKVCGSVEAAVVEGADTGLLGLGADFLGKVHLVVRRADARAEHGDDVFRAGAEIFVQRLETGGKDISYSAFFAGMEQADGAGLAVGKPDRAAICDVNREDDAGLICDKSIHAWDAGQPIRGGDFWGGGDDGDGGAMDLLGAPPSCGIATEARNHALVMGAQGAHCGIAVARDA